ncbi:MAG: FecR family protein [Planctomycetales bacterium]
MNDEHELRETLFPLLDALIEGDLSGDDHARLEALLDENAEARRLYSQYLELDLGMRQLQLSDAQPNAVEELARRIARQTPGSRARFVLLGAVLATAACLLIALFSYPPWQASDASSERIANRDPGRETTNQEETKPAIAKIMRLLDARWSEGGSRFSLGESLGQEWLRVSSGIVQLEFSSGAALTLEGPAQLRIDSETECFLQQGKVVVLGPPDLPEFTITSPGSRVVDKGTEFAVVVSESGETDVHVLDGKVDVSLVDDNQRSAEPQRLVESEAATLNPALRRIQSLPFDGESFEFLRPNNLARGQPLRIQFDCGVRAGVYDGIQSPAHAAGDFHQHERFWNPIIGDQAGGFAAADGTPLSGKLEIDFGQTVRGHKTVDWDEPPTMRGSSGDSRGVFHTSLGEDGIRGGNRVGLRVGGLPPGKYRVYVIGRSSIVHPKWGNYLTDKAYDCLIGVDQAADAQPIDPLEDENAGRWIDGQTHAVGEVKISGPNEYLQLIVNKDRDRSPVPAGGGATILGVQIMQMTE